MKATRSPLCEPIYLSVVLRTIKSCVFEVQIHEGLLVLTKQAIPNTTPRVSGLVFI